MWILKNSKDLLEYIKYMPLSFCNTIKAFDNSTLYTTIPHSKLQDRLKELVQLCFLKQNDQRRYKYLVLGMNISYFVKKKNTLILSKIPLKLISSTCSSFWIDNIFAMFGGHTFGYKLRSSSQRLVALFVCGRLHTEVLKKNEKKIGDVFHYFFLRFVISLIASITLSLTYSIPRIQIVLLHTLTYT